MQLIKHMFLHIWLTESFCVTLDFELKHLPESGSAWHPSLFSKKVCHAKILMWKRPIALFKLFMEKSNFQIKLSILSINQGVNPMTQPPC